MFGKAALASFLWLGASFTYAQPDLASARSALSEFGAVCAAEGSRMWAVPLCGRIVIVEPRSRRAVGTAKDPENQFTERDGLYEGTLPSQFLLANTSIRWGTEEWAMVMLPLPQDKFSRIRLLAHESFHRAQKELKLNASDAPNAHLDTESGRLWLRLELRALAQALRSSDAASRQATDDALLFWAVRRNVNLGADRNENALEIQEGLAEYTGTVIALRATGESINRVARGVEAFEDQTAYSRSFANATGPALGLLLDRYAPEWRSAVTTERGMSDLLAKAVDLKPGPGLAAQAKQRAATYGYEAVAEDEQVRESRRRLQSAAFRTRFLDGPILQFPRTAEMQRSFNPSNLVTLGEAGTVYPTGTFTSRWGRLQVDDIGALLSPDNQSLRVSAPGDAAAKPLTGPGWLELAPGWTIRPSAKAGNFDVVPQP